MPKVKQTAAEIELQLSERRFILEAMNTAATVVQVPIVTAFVWWAMSERSLTLRKLNKAIIAAELTPLLGDIAFPPGVVLGAAAESIDDLDKILKDAGITIGEIVQKGTDFATDTIFEILVPKNLTCIQLKARQSELIARIRGIEKGEIHEAHIGEQTKLGLELGGVATRVKEKCGDDFIGVVRMKP